MKKIFIIFVVIWVLALVLVAYKKYLPETVVTQLKTITPTPTPTHLDPYKIYNLINDYRASNGLNKLVFNPAMCEFTELRLSQVHKDWSHNGFNPQVYSAYNFTHKGENLTKGQKSEEAMVNAWIASPTHLENITAPRFTQTCIAVDNFNDTFYAVQEFASY